MIALPLHKQLNAIWRAGPGWRGKLASVNHSDIGRRFIIAAFVFFAIGGVLAMLDKRYRFGRREEEAKA